MKIKLKQKQLGFTMIELMISLAIVGILMSYAIPAYREFGLRQKVTNESNNLLGDLTFTRVTAIKEGQAVVIRSLSGIDWSNGWQIFLDKDRDGAYSSGDVRLRLSQAKNQNIIMTGTDNRAEFNNLGSANVVNVITISHADISKTVILSVSPSGMVSTRG